MKPSIIVSMNILALFKGETSHFCANKGFTNVLALYLTLSTKAISHFNAKVAIKSFKQHVLTEMLVLWLGLIA